MQAVRKYFEGIYFRINYRESVLLGRMARRFFRRGSRQIERRVCRIVKPYAPVSVLDLGCGPGHVLTSLAEQHDLREVVGVDVSLPALRLAEARLANVPSASFHLGDLRTCPALADRYDVVLAIGVFDYCQFDATVLRAMLDASNRLAVATMPKRRLSPQRALRRLWLGMNGVRLLSYDEDEVAAAVSGANADRDFTFDVDIQWEHNDNIWLTCIRRQPPARN